MLVNRRFLDGFNELEAKIEALEANDNSNVSNLENRVAILEASSDSNSSSDIADFEARIAILEASDNNGSSSLSDDIAEIKAEITSLRNDFDTLTSG